MPKKRKPKKTVVSLKHAEASRTNIPTAEFESVMEKQAQSPIRVAYERRNRDLDPQLVWRGKDEQDWSDLVTYAPPLYIQEKVKPKALVDDLLRRSKQQDQAQDEQGLLFGDLYADFNGLPDGVDKTDFYQHEGNWQNRMILGDSLQVMASLAEREGLRGKVQCIYIDPPYGIKFNSNFQWSTTSRDVRDGKVDHITREPEQVKAFRDTWRDGIHSYLTYLRDRLTVARDLLHVTGSIFVQIGDENVHRVRDLLDEVFGADNFAAFITFRKKMMPLGSDVAEGVSDYILWYAKERAAIKARPIFQAKTSEGDSAWSYMMLDSGERHRLTTDQRNNHTMLPKNARVYQAISLLPAQYRPNQDFVFPYQGKQWNPPKKSSWKTDLSGMSRLSLAGRLHPSGSSLRYVLFHADYPVGRITNLWADSSGATQQVYVVQTNVDVVKRCLLMVSDPGDLIVDPTCGSGTTAYAAEQWGRRWITIDTSRVALALARARIMGARYTYYLLADSKQGQEKEAEISRSVAQDTFTNSDIRQGFVYERVPHITLGSIANNTEIDVIWEKFQETLQPLRERLNGEVGRVKGEKGREPWEEWEIPREADNNWSAKAKKLHAQWWESRIARQKETDASIAAKADYEYLYDKPYEDTSKVRVAGPFTVESLSPHRVLAVDEDDELIDEGRVKGEGGRVKGDGEADFVAMILENLKMAGVQQAHREDKISFSSISPWPGHFVCAEGRYVEKGEGGSGKGEDVGPEKRAGIFIGPEFGTVARADLVAAAREAGDAEFDVLIACAFNYDAHSSEFDKLGRVPVLKARMNADLHMAGELKQTDKANLFVIFGEPDVEVISGQWLVARAGRLVVNYEQCQELSGLGSLEEINRLGQSDLRRFKELSAGRAVRNDESVASSGGVDSGEHRRGSRQDGNGGVSSVSQRSERVAGGSGDAVNPRREIGDASGGTDGSDSQGMRGNQPHARWTQAVAQIQALTARDFPLSLTTNHYTQVTINGVDVFHPNTGEVRSDGAEGIACWFIDTDYNEESFFVRHAYFLGANDPYKSLKTTLKAEINQEAWETLHSDTSRPFNKPNSGRIAVKVINHLGDEVMKVFRVE